MSNQPFRDTADSAPAILWTTDPSGACTYLSRQWYELTGQTPDQGLGFGWTDAVHPDDREPSAAIFTKANERRVPFELDYRLRRHDGVYLWAVDAGQPWFSQAGEFLGYVGSVLDISERKAAEEALRQSEERLQRVTATSPAILYTLVPDGNAMRTTWVSDNIEDILGYPVAEAVVAGWWFDKLHPADLDAAVARQETLFRVGSLTHEYRLRHKDGTYRWIRDQLRVVAGSEAGDIEVVGSWMDATEFRQMEDQFHQAQKMEAVGRLAGGIAHDFNNVLTVVEGFAHILLEDVDETHPHRHDIREIVTASERGSRLVRQLLEFSRQQVVQPELVDLNALVTGMEGMLRRLIDDDVELATHLDPAAGWVRADRGQLEQVLLNLVINARDAVAGQGRITVSTEATYATVGAASAHADGAPGSHVMLSVCDTGCGMERELQEKIFEPFFTTKEQGKGSGLGLSIVYGIVRQSGGNLGVESTPGVGSTFTVCLPRVESIGDTVPEVPTTAAPTGSERVLLVEDQPSVRAFVRRALERRGYQVLEAETGLDAIRISERESIPIDLLLTDVVMPGMGGRELAVRLLASRPGLRVLFMSGYAEHEIAHRGALAPGTHFIEKPLSPETLAVKVRRVLDAPSPIGDPSRAGEDPSRP